MFASQGLRTATLGYSASDGLRQQFTAKERDIETGLDYFEARYYASMQGRFTSIDPQNMIFEKNRGGNADERARILQSYVVQPQNWNRYAYTQGSDGQPRTATLGEGRETTIDALTEPTVPIQSVTPTCNCEKRPEDERRKNEDD